MENARIFTICIFAFLYQISVSAQCAHVYFYRPQVLLQIPDAVLVFHKGQQIASVLAGERYDATVCSVGNHKFSVKSATDQVDLLNETINVQSGKEYYIKLGNHLLPSIKEVDVATGKNEFKNAARHSGAIKNISIGNSSSAQGVTPNTPHKTNSTTPSNPTLPPNTLSVVQNNIRFDIVNITKAGELLVFDYKITNLSNEDRHLDMCCNMTHFYDDLGNPIFPSKICLMNDCEVSSQRNRAGQVQSEYYCNGSAGGILPSNIPVNAQITFNPIEKRSTKFLRGTIWTEAEQDFKVEYGEITFPSDVDPTNPKKKIFGSQTIELIGAKRNGNTAIVQFKHENKGNAMYSHSVTSGIVYDDLGNQLSVDALGIVKPNPRIEQNRQYYEWKRDINPYSVVDFYLHVDGVANAAQMLRRITVEYEGFSFSWENVPIQ